MLDPTCGGGTTAFVSEQWARRWITIDSSRIALNIARNRLTTAVFTYYAMHDPSGKDVRQGFVYRKVPHVTLKSIANGEPAEEETLYDQPLVEKGKMRVTGPFTVETLQAYDPLPPSALDEPAEAEDTDGAFEARVFAHLTSAGVKNGYKGETAVFSRITPLADPHLHAEGFFTGGDGRERKAYVHVGPLFSAVAKPSVGEAIKATRTRGDADWLLVLGFTFEGALHEQGRDLGTFRVDLVRMGDDLLQEGLLKKDRKAAAFVTIGEPDVRLVRETTGGSGGDGATGSTGTVHVEVAGLDLYDPIRDEVKARSVADVAYWTLDDDYNGTDFVVRQLFFCGGERGAFDRWKKGLSDLAKGTAKKNAERALRVEIDEEAFDRLYGYVSHPVEARPGRKIAVRVVSQFGEESTKVLTVS